MNTNVFAVTFINISIRTSMKEIAKSSPKPKPKPGAVLVSFSKSPAPAPAPAQAPGIVLSRSRVTLTSKAKLLVSVVRPYKCFHNLTLLVIRAI